MQMQGLRILTITGMELEILGPVTHQDHPDGRVYYCGGQSWPAEIVKEVLG